METEQRGPNSLRRNYVIPHLEVALEDPFPEAKLDNPIPRQHKIHSADKRLGPKP